MDETVRSHMDGGEHAGRQHHRDLSDRSRGAARLSLPVEVSVDVLLRGATILLLVLIRLAPSRREHSRNAPCVPATAWPDLGYGIK